MTSTDADATGEGEAFAGSETATTPDDEAMDHGGLIDVERLPGGSRLTAVRADLVDRYRGFLSLDTANRETVLRWGFGSIISHWLLVVSMVVAGVTGFAFWTGWYGLLDVGIWDGYQVSFDLHVWAGVILAVIALLLFPFYHKFVDGHRLLLSRTQVKEQIVIGLAFLGLMRYIPGYKQGRRVYDEAEDEWVGNHPTQTSFWYATWVFVLILTFTGFALWRGISTQPPWWIESLGFMGAWFSYERLLVVHLVAAIWILALVVVHAYVALLPGNRDIFRSMIGGKLKAWVVDSESRADPHGAGSGTQEETETND
jgi:Ni/Fe-hydrogenase 1 B-type cytochrome subunit